MNDIAEQLERERRAQRLVNAYHRLFGTKTGKMVLEDLQKRFGNTIPVFSPLKDGSYDVTWAAVRDGQRQVILHIEHFLNLPFKGDGNIEQPKTNIITS